MSVHVHVLSGCKPTPLAHYLKALGVLRLVATQVDPTARGCFRDDTFVLVTSLDEAELMDFFLGAYAPTPLIAPWNGGSGFYPKDNKEAIDALRASTAPRLAGYRAALGLASDVVGKTTEAPKDAPKFALQRAVRQRADGALADWLDAVVVFDAEGEPSYPALLGTGGNDGRLDFTNNFMQRVCRLFDVETEDGAPSAGSSEQLRAALWGTPVDGLTSLAIGQFLPGSVGGSNSGFGFRGTAAVNAWDYVLMLEGAVMLQCSATKQLESQQPVQAGAPFAFRATAVGYASAADLEDDGSRGEQWMPLWSQPASHGEVRALFAEGRSQLARTRAQRPLDFARSVARLGVSRGVDAFQRYGFIERNGQANLAVPLARWKVSPGARQDLVDDVAGWVDRLRVSARGDTAPASVARAARRCERALLSACASGASSAVWQQVLIELGSAERALVRSMKFSLDRNLRPLSALSADWLLAARDDSAEWRIACALASIHAWRTDGGSGDKPRIDWNASIRGYGVPMSGTTARREFTAMSPRVVMQGRDVVSDLCAMLLRRSLEAAVGGRGTLGLLHAHGTAAHLDDLATFLDASTDDARILNLFWSLSAITWGEAGPQARQAPARPHDTHRLGALTAFGVLRTAIRPSTPESGDDYPKLDRSILTALFAGRSERALATASTRLRASGLVPKVRAFVMDPSGSRRLMAALALPISDLAERRLRGLVCRTNTEDSSAEIGETNA